MLQKHDTLFLWIFIIIGALLLLRYLYKHFTYSIPIDTIDPNDKLVQILNDAGYTIIRRKIRIPVSISETDKTYESRYFIDAIAKKDGLIYAVKVSRARRPLEMSGSAIRDQLLPIFLLSNWDGVLYIEVERQSIQSFFFNIEKSFIPKKNNLIPFLITFIAGMIFAFIIL